MIFKRDFQHLTPGGAVGGGAPHTPARLALLRIDGL